MAGLCAAIASARNGAKTCLVQDRPVYGGNASSEVRMWVCGAHGKHNKETGLLEEVQLENCYRNSGLNYCVWDSVLYGKAHFQPNLTPLLNTTCVDAEMDGQTIRSIRCWTLTSQTWHTINARLFIDCSGDSILAPLTGAACRRGREAREEFGEDIEPAIADDRTMGNSLLIQLRRTDEPQPFIPPKWAYKFTSPSDLPHRVHGVRAHNFWWIELGGLQDTIGDAESIRDELMRVTYGVWDYLKNHAPQREEASRWAIEWIGSLPGKRENRRYEGDHILTQHDVRAAGKPGYFDDIVAYGGWSMDDHHPAGLLYPGKPTLFHPAPSPYGIPYRCLYSRNVPNLLFAGRNISVTHAALSSTRVMATCAMLGQAAGTAAALCTRHACEPRALSTGEKLRQLQQTLMDDDCWLPGLTRGIDAITAASTLHAPRGDVARLIDGTDRDLDNEPHAWEAPVGTPIELRWDAAVDVAGLRLTLDSNLANDKRMPCSYPQKGDRCLVPGTLIKRFRIEAMDASGDWAVVHREGENYQRLVRLPLKLRTTAIRFVPEEAWGSDIARVFALEAMQTFEAKVPPIPDGPHWSQVAAAVPPRDLAPPDSGLEETATKQGGAA
jgi:hypothetical protein